MWGLLVGLMIAIVIAAFASLNSIPIDLSFIVWEAQGVPLSLVILFSVLLGAMMSILFGIPGYLKTQKQKKDMERRIRDQDKKIKTLESLPLVKQGIIQERDEKSEKEKNKQNPAQN